MNTTTTPHPDRSSRRVDVRGWIVLAWVAVWTVAYVHSALGARFPWIRSWIPGLS